jgi:hypothetical protein
VALQFVDLEFEHSYEVEINPEYPSAGAWTVPSFQFGDKGEDMATIKVHPGRGGAWVASFALEGRGVLNGVFACPNPGQFLVVTGWDAFLLQADDASLAKALTVHPITVVARPTGTDLLLVGSFTDAAALDDTGIRWVTDRLFLDDFKLLNSAPGKISVQGTSRSNPGDSEVLTIDPVSGRVISAEGQF